MKNCFTSRRQIVFLLCCSISLMMTACTHTPPEKRSSVSEIRQYIVSTWTLDERSDIDGFQGFEISPDGTLTKIKLDGTSYPACTWHLDGKMLVIQSSKASTTTTSDRTVTIMGEPSYYPVIYASEHELVCGLGISVAGRMRFKK